MVFKYYCFRKLCIIMDMGSSVIMGGFMGSFFGGVVLVVGVISIMVMESCRSMYC